MGPWLALLGSCRTARSLARVHARLVAAGLGGDLPCQTKLASAYAELGDIAGAAAVFYRVDNPDLYSWKVMLRWLLQREKHAGVLGLYSRMRLAGLAPDNSVYAGSLKAAAELRCSWQARKLHCVIAKAGGSPDGFVLNTLLDAYGKCGALDCARRVFDEMPDRDVVSWSCMIGGCVQNESAEEGLSLFIRMRRETETEPNEFTVGGLVAAGSALDSPRLGRCVHGYVIKRFMAGNVFLATRLLGMYAEWGMTDDARGVFDQLPAVDVVSWTAMIAGYAQAGAPRRAVELFRGGGGGAAVPNAFTLASLLSAASQLEDPVLGETLHGLAAKLGLGEEAQVTNAALTMYARGGRFCDARRLFDACAGPRRDVVTWNAIIAGYAQGGLAVEALSLFLRMRSAGPAPDAVTFVAALSACAAAGDFSAGQQCHAEATKRGVLANVFVATALLDVYAKSGDEAAARAIFDGMSRRSNATWGAMISAHGAHGDPARSLALLGEMAAATTTMTAAKDHVTPNEAVYTAALTACRHTGMVAEGRELFSRLCADPETAPSMAHYSSMVDLLARAGRLEEAMEFIQRMPQPPSAGVWGAFLHGCRVHSQIDLGESAVRRMLELHPTDASYYLLMSGLYASQGRWPEAAKIRQLMRSRGLSKSPGCSISNTC
ncbi:pentatricopeptide repeat (PPR) superfamily protein [Wolffia australiana]